MGWWAGELIRRNSRCRDALPTSGKGRMVNHWVVAESFEANASAFAKKEKPSSWGEAVKNGPQEMRVTNALNVRKAWSVKKGVM